jgi:glycosyltransferase involved in cell wall biosynthesis
MPGTRDEREPDDLIRAHPDQLCDPIWWQALNLDFVVLYAWGDPRYLPIATAIRKSGSTLIQNLDSSGIDTPYADPDRWWISLRDHTKGSLPLTKKLRLYARGVRDLVPAIYERKRLSMLAEADLLACVSPPAMDCMADYVTALGAPQLVGKLRVIPHPAMDEMRYDGEEKKNCVLCVGRWNEVDHHQKDPILTLKILYGFLIQNPDWKAEIIGNGADSLPKLSAWPNDPLIAGRIHLTGSMPRELLREKYLKSRILLCASRYESFHISSAEALCCGSSVVTANHPLLASTRWFVSCQSGSLANTRSETDLLEAINKEALAWEHSKRNPTLIANSWRALVTGTMIAHSILNHINSLESVHDL